MPIIAFKPTVFRGKRQSELHEQNIDRKFTYDTINIYDSVNAIHEINAYNFRRSLTLRFFQSACNKSELSEEVNLKTVEKKVVTLNVNGKTYDFLVGDGIHEVSEGETLAVTLRDRLHLTGLKIGCDQGACGSCTVIMDGLAIASCMTLTLDCAGKSITTIEGLADSETGELSGLQQSFVDNCGFQCGFCTAGIIMASEALLEKKPKPSEEEVREALSGNYCRCGTHYTAVDAVMAYVNREE